MVFQKQFTYGMRCASIVIAVTVFFLSAQSALPVPSSDSFPGFDKLLHACAFGSLAFAFSYWVAAEKWRTAPFKYFVLVWFVTACYGITDELHQYFVPGRDASVYDWFADCTGATFAVILRMRMVKKVDRIAG